MASFTSCWDVRGNNATSATRYTGFPTTWATSSRLVIAIRYDKLAMLTKPDSCQDDIVYTVEMDYLSVHVHRVEEYFGDGVVALLLGTL